MLCLQVAAGAEVILTQPPLLRAAFDTWVDGMLRYVMYTLNSLILACDGSLTNGMLQEAVMAS